MSLRSRNSQPDLLFGVHWQAEEAGGIAPANGLKIVFRKAECVEQPDRLVEGRPDRRAVVAEEDMFDAKGLDGQAQSRGRPEVGVTGQLGKVAARGAGQAIWPFP